MFSCSHHQEKSVDFNDFKTDSVKIFTLDSLQNPIIAATIKLKIPKTLDTFYKWQRTSDCFSCGWLQYRFANKKYPQFAESGFFWTVEPDSVCQLTIRHKPSASLDINSNRNILNKSDSNLVFSFIKSSFDCQDYKVSSMKLVNINEREFYIAAIETQCSYLTLKPALYVYAVTELRSLTLEFIAEYSGDNKNYNFEKEMLTAIHSVGIAEK